MATGLDVETVTGQLAREQPKSDRQSVLEGFTRAGNGLNSLKGTKSMIDDIVSDGVAAGERVFELEKIQADWGVNLRDKFVGNGSTISAWTYAGKTGIDALAQLIADFSEQAGVDGGNNRIRIFKGQSGSEAIVPVDQDA